jgi:hypothetical protein
VFNQRVVNFVDAHKQHLFKQVKVKVEVKKNPLNTPPPSAFRLLSTSTLTSTCF